MRKVLLILSVVVLGGGTAEAQKIKDYLKYGDEAFADGDYYGASLLYANAMAIDSNDFEIVWRYAESLRMYNEYEKAAYYYEKIYKKDKGKLYVDAIFWLGIMQKYNGDYREAVKTFKWVEKRYKDKTSYHRKKCTHERESCSWAIGQVGDTLPIKVENLGLGVNTTDSEFGAILHDNTLYFTSLRAENMGENKVVHDEQYAIRIYSAAPSGEDSWSGSEPLPAPINDLAMHSANGSFSPDGKRFYFSRCDNEYGCNIYMSSFDGSNWGEPVMLEDKINGEDFTSTQPHVAMVDDKEVLFFSSDMKGTEGGLDLWWSEIKDNGAKYTKPKNMSKVINTIDNEITPFYDSEEGVLYFSSEWYNNLGGYDVFMSPGTLNDFDEPVNAGAPINTSWNDFYFTKVPESNIGFVTSNRKGSYTVKGETCCNDIYKLTFEGELNYSDTIQTLEDLNKYLPVTLYFHNDRPDPRSWDTVTTLNYMTTYDRYTAMSEEYRTEYSNVAVDPTGAAEEIDDFFAHYVDQGVSDLELFSELLLIELEKGQDIEVTVRGFASPLAKTEYNVPLTLRRISSMINYLYEYQGGIYRQYLEGPAPNGGNLSFIKIPFGEYTADQTISDDRELLHESVYSPGAMAERRIQIESVHLATKDTAYAEPTFAEEIKDFGAVTKGDILEHTFYVTNTGNANLTITSVKPECGCTVAEYTKNVILPGEKGMVQVSFDTTTKTGITAVHVEVETDGVPATKQLSITAEIHEPDGN